MSLPPGHPAKSDTNAGDAPHAPDRCAGERDGAAAVQRRRQWRLPHGIANNPSRCALPRNSIRQDDNGYSSSDVTSEGARNGAIDALKDGSSHAGCCRRAPPQGREWLEPRVDLPADLEAADRRRLSGGRRHLAVCPVRVGIHMEKAKGPRTRSKKAWPDSWSGLPCRAARPQSRVLGPGRRVTSCLAATRNHILAASPRHDLSPGYPSARQLRPRRSRRGLCRSLALDVHAAVLRSASSAHGVAGEPARNGLKVASL